MRYADKHKIYNDAAAVCVVFACFGVLVGVSSLALLDREYIAQEELKAANAKKEEEFQSRVDELAAQLYEEYLETAPTREQIAYMKNSSTPARFVEAARARLQSRL
jgi:hypothetical protein